MDATDKQKYRTHFVVNSPRYGREPIMWIVRLPVSCGLNKLELARGLTPLEVQQTVSALELTEFHHGALARWQ